MKLTREKLEEYTNDADEVKIHIMDLLDLIDQHEDYLIGEFDMYSINPNSPTNQLKASRNMLREEQQQRKLKPNE